MEEQTDLVSGEGEWMNIAIRGEFKAKTIKSVSNYPMWDREAKANVVRFEFEDGTHGDLLIFYRGNLGPGVGDEQ